jgi:hypothetical protein
MRTDTGGTKKYCPYCEEICICQSKTVGEQRWYSPSHPDIQWFRRELTCLSCGGKFVTAELQEEFLKELMALRNALGNIKINAEQYLRESKSASLSLERLSKALGVLRALDIYQQELAD